jgi:GrpB-like predicted nucleotidyltransferase (UPF0157 family)
MEIEDVGRHITVVDYDPRWVAEFETESDRVRKVLREEIISIEHIGSTSIPGMCAKPVIDILVVVRSIGRIDLYNRSMLDLGYIAKGEFGIAGRRFFLKGVPARTHHLHIFQERSQEIGRHLHFRDYLAAHPDEARRYCQLKRELASRHELDIDAYSRGKDEFIKEIDRKTEDWARKRDGISRT